MSLNERDWTDGPVRLMHGDVRERLADLEPESVQCVVTSPPYWGLRDYGTASWEGGDAECAHASVKPPRGFREGLSEQGLSAWSTREHYAASAVCRCGARRVDSQLGLEATPEAYVTAMADVFRAVWRVLRRDGTLWLNLGDSYANTGGMTGGTNSKDGGAARAARMFKGGYRALTDGIKAKDLVGIPWRVAFALQAAGWYLRSDIIWSKPNPMPESVQDRPTKAHEYLFLLTRSERYYYDAGAIREAEAPATAERYGYDFKDRYADVADAKGYRGAFGGKDPKWKQAKNRAAGPGPDGHARLVDHVREARANGAEHDNPLGPGGRNKRSVWEIATQAYPEAHFATFPEALVEPCIKAGTAEGDVVLDPFAGSGTTLAVARRLGRRAIGIELQPDYLPLIQRRVMASAMPLTEAIRHIEEASA